MILRRGRCQTCFFCEQDRLIEATYVHSSADQRVTVHEHAVVERVKTRRTLFSALLANRRVLDQVMNSTLPVVR
jgi:hypothetical protein